MNINTIMDVFKIIGLILLGIALLIIGPHITIWALNLAFGFNIGHGLAEWFAILWLSTLVWGHTGGKNK